MTLATVECSQGLEYPLIHTVTRSPGCTLGASNDWSQHIDPVVLDGVVMAFLPDRIDITYCQCCEWGYTVQGICTTPLPFPVFKSYDDCIYYRTKRIQYVNVNESAIVLLYWWGVPASKDATDLRFCIEPKLSSVALLWWALCLLRERHLSHEIQESAAEKLFHAREVMLTQIKWW